MFQVTYTKNHRMHIDMNSNDSNKDKILIVFLEIRMNREGMTSGHLTNIKLNLLNLHLQKSRCLTYIRYVKT